MTIQIDLKPEMEAWLVAGAQARGMPVEKHAEALLQGRNQAFSLSSVVLKFGKLPLGSRTC
jgi:hypothetical protein